MKIIIDTHEDTYNEWQHVKNLMEDQHQMMTGARIPDATSKEIDMLAKATEIQEMWQPSLYDMVAFDDEIYLIFEIDHCAQNIVCTTIDGMVFQIPPKNRDRDVVWIPGQDQMENMMFDKQTNGSFIGLMSAMRRGARKERVPLSTMQLQICGIMYRAFGKQWNGNDWEMIE